MLIQSEISFVLPRPPDRAWSLKIIVLAEKLNFQPATDRGARLSHRCSQFFEHQLNFMNPPSIVSEKVRRMILAISRITSLDVVSTKIN
jgi:hypothetical protein